MLKFTVKRLLYSVLILFFVMFLIYALIYSMPNGYVETKARELASRPGTGKSAAEWLADLNAQYGMDKGVVMGYFTWLKSAVTGNFGDSWYGLFRFLPSSKIPSGIALPWDSFPLSFKSSLPFLLASAPQGSSTPSRTTPPR